MMRLMLFIAGACGLSVLFAARIPDSTPDWLMCSSVMGLFILGVLSIFSMATAFFGPDEF